MKTGWSLIDNPFLNATAGSYKRMMGIARYTHSALQKFSSDPFFLSLYNDYNPVYALYETSYAKWNSGKGGKKAQTDEVVQLLKKLSNPNIGRWSAAIRVQYTKGTPRYKDLLPHGTAPFHNGSREVRISMVSALSKAIGSDTNLVSLKAEIDAFYQLLSQGRDTQLGDISGTKTLSAKVEQQRKALAVALMIVYAQLVMRYSANLESIEMFFDLENLRDKRQKTFTRHIKPGKSKTIVKRTLLPDDELKIKNTGSVPLMVCVTSAKRMVCETGVTVQPNAEEIIQAQQLGDVAQLKFITLTNPGEQEGSCVITLM